MSRVELQPGDAGGIYAFGAGGSNNRRIQVRFAGLGAVGGATYPSVGRVRLSELQGKEGLRLEQMPRYKVGHRPAEVKSSGAGALRQDAMIARVKGQTAEGL